MKPIHYRADIDGLRAVAVLLVVFHHLTPAVVPGGYVGVDVFFVISGFLITGQIIDSRHAGDFTFSAFYKRRINRIVPPLLVVLCATLLVGLVALSPLDYILVAKSALTALVGLSNFFFWREYGNYFAGNAAEAPLLHTWSLGVEEQFYFVWPLLCVLLLKLPRRWALSVVATGVVCGLVLSQVSLSIAASASYYLMPTRFFELLTRCALAIALVGRSGVVAPPLVGWMGLGLIVGSSALLDKSSSFPGINAVWPCLGAALLIAAGGVAPLRSPVAVGVGLISYSLYLWHWPIIAYMNYARIPVNVGTGLGALLLAIALSYASWRYVERPARRSGNRLAFRSVFLQRLGLPVAAAAVFAAAVSYTGGFASRFSPEVASLESALLARPEQLRSGCHVPTGLYAVQPNPAKCHLGAEGKATAMLIGDSYANHFTGMLDVLGKRDGVSILDYTMDGCPPLPGYDTGKGEGYASKCKARNRTAFEYLKASGMRIVILAASWPDNAGDALLASVADLRKAGLEVVIVQKNQQIPDAGSCAVRASMHATSDQCTAAQTAPPAYMAVVKQTFPGVRFIDPSAATCERGVCRTVINGLLLYRDSGHLNDLGSRAIGRLLAERTRGPLLLPAPEAKSANANWGP